MHVRRARISLCVCSGAEAVGGACEQEPLRAIAEVAASFQVHRNALSAHVATEMAVLVVQVEKAEEVCAAHHTLLERIANSAAAAESAPSAPQDVAGMKNDTDRSESALDAERQMRSVLSGLSSAMIEAERKVRCQA